MHFREFLSPHDFRETKSFEEEESEQRIVECQVRQNVQGCSECRYFDSCEVIKAHLRAKAGYGAFGEKSSETPT
jgi:hypothetical protein